MLKAEKYKERIKELGYSFALCKGEMEDCQRADCENCEFVSDSGCTLKKIKWLLEECREPILTEKEKAYLKNVIEPLNVVVDYIRKCENYTSEDNIFYTVVVRVKHSEKFNCSYVLIDFVVTKDMPFEGMKPQKKYTSEELGL